MTDEDPKTRVYDFAEATHVTAVDMVMRVICDVAREKNADPIKQISGYVVSGDATFIPRDQNARGMLKKLDRDEIVEELVESYLRVHGQI